MNEPFIHLFFLRLDLHQDLQKSINALSESIRTVQGLQEYGTAAVLVRVMIVALHLHFETFEVRPRRDEV